MTGWKIKRTLDNKAHPVEYKFPDDLVLAAGQKFKVSLLAHSHMHHTHVNIGLLMCNYEIGCFKIF